ncbi:MAG: ABC transporter ATP-binding protein [Ignavibacteriaceae bacterium]|nr:ABC transporter ATP-binding protein [Ignavibacteriaceae bacterium]
MTDFSLQVSSLQKSFGRRLVFNGINFSLNKSCVFGITGPNGSGKSTLIKILAGINSPTKGKVVHTSNGKAILSESLHNYIGFVSPYLVLYDEFSAWENLKYFASIRSVPFNKERVKNLLEKFLLLKREDDLVKTYSSGMKQRLKFIFALMHSPKFIFLDEPTSNLDDEGKQSVYDLIKNESEKAILVVASNEKNDLAYCSEILDLKKYKN